MSWLHIDDATVFLTSLITRSWPPSESISICPPHPLKTWIVLLPIGGERYSINLQHSHQKLWAKPSCHMVLPMKVQNPGRYTSMSLPSTIFLNEPSNFLTLMRHWSMLSHSEFNSKTRQLSMSRKQLARDVLAACLWLTVGLATLNIPLFQLIVLFCVGWWPQYTNDICKLVGIYWMFQPLSNYIFSVVGRPWQLAFSTEKEGLYIRQPALSVGSRKPLRGEHWDCEGTLRWSQGISPKWCWQRCK